MPTKLPVLVYWTEKTLIRVVCYNNRLFLDQNTKFWPFLTLFYLESCLKSNFWSMSLFFCFTDQTSTPSDGPLLRIKTINLIQITKINFKNINSLKKWPKTAQNSIMSPHAMYFWQKRPKRPKNFSQNIHWVIK